MGRSTRGVDRRMGRQLPILMTWLTVEQRVETDWVC